MSAVENNAQCIVFLFPSQTLYNIFFPFTFSICFSFTEQTGESVLSPFLFPRKCPDFAGHSFAFVWKIG